MAGKPDQGRKPGGELPYSETESVIGGPHPDAAKAGLGEGFEVKGKAGEPAVKRGKTLKQQKANGQEGSGLSKPQMRGIDESNY